MDTQIIELTFPVQGKTIPVDHGYALYGSLCRLCPELHESDEVAVQLIRGKFLGDGLLNLSSHSCLKLRTSAHKQPMYLKLSGKKLDLDGHMIRLGVPTPYLLKPAAALYSHLVTTKNGDDEIRFRTGIEKKMEDMNVLGKYTILKRRTFKIHNKQIVGYSILMSELTAEESLTLQEKGLGGRRKMGCGVFVEIQ